MVHKFRHTPPYMDSRLLRIYKMILLGSVPYTAYDALLTAVEKTASYCSVYNLAPGAMWYAVCTCLPPCPSEGNVRMYHVRCVHGPCHFLHHLSLPQRVCL